MYPKSPFFIFFALITLNKHTGRGCELASGGDFGDDFSFIKGNAVYYQLNGNIDLMLNWLVPVKFTLHWPVRV